MDGMAMVTTLKSNAARNTAASIRASAYQRLELMDMACRFAGSVPVGATLLTLDVHLCHCRLPRTSARPSARSAPGTAEKGWPSNGRTPGSVVTCRDSRSRLLAGIPRAKGVARLRCSPELRTREGARGCVDLVKDGDGRSRWLWGSWRSCSLHCWSWAGARARAHRSDQASRGRGAARW